MKKRLLMLPMMAGLLLSGCNFTTFEKTIPLFKLASDTSSDLPKNFKVEYEGYKMATKLKDGGQYILGVYRINENLMRFADGNYYSDSKGQYSSSLGTTTDVEQAAIVEATSLGNDEFSLKMIAIGTPWHNKYIGVYGAVGAYGNKFLSIAPLDELDQTTFTVTNKKTTSQVTANTSTHFKYYETYEDMPAYSVAAMYQHEGVDLEGAVPKFIGTGHNQSDGEPDYTCMDCKSCEVALSLVSFDLAHLYEKK